MLTADQETFTTHQVKFSDISPNRTTMTTSTETKVNSTNSSKNIRPKCANISWKRETAHSCSSANSLTDPLSWDNQMTHSQRTSERLLSVLSTPTTRPSHARTSPTMENASLVTAAPSTTRRASKESWSTHFQTCRMVLLFQLSPQEIIIKTSTTSKRTTTIILAVRTVTMRITTVASKSRISTKPTCFRSPVLPT